MADPKIKFDILANAQGDESITRLTTELEKLDQSIDGDVAERAQALARELRLLGTQTEAVDNFRQLKTEVGAATVALDKAQQEAQALGKELAATQAPTRGQTGQLEKLKETVKAARAELTAKTEALIASRGELGRLGISTDQLAQKEIALRGAVQTARAEIQTLGQQQQAVQRITELAQATEKARTALSASDAALSAYRRSIADLASPTQAQQRELERLTNAVRTSQVAFLQAAQAQASSAASARAAGVDSERLAQAAQRVANSYRTQAVEATRSAATQTAAHRQIAQGVDSINNKLGTLQNIGIAGILGGRTTQLLRSVAETADQFSNLSARIRLVTGDGAAFEAAMQGVFQVAKNTSTSLESTATLFTRIAQAGKEIGLSQKDALALTQSINQAVQLSGASAQSSDAAITQLIQGLQSGVVRGEEFNTVMEQSPRVAKALADGLGVTTGELRKLSNEGKLSATTVIRALQSQSQVLESEFGKLPATVGRALTNLNTEWAKFIGGLNNSTGATGAVAAGINTIAENLEVVARVAGVAGTALVAGLAVKGAAALRAYAAEAALAAGATNLLTASIAKVPAVVNITVAAVGFEVGYEIGKMLYENTELARQLGAGLVGFFELIVNDLQFLKEAAVALFTDGTVEEAIERWKAKNIEVGNIIRDMMVDAKQGPKEVASAADEATLSTQKLGTAATNTGQQIAAAAPQAAGAMGQIGAAAATAESAIGAIAKAAKLELPQVGATAAELAQGMVDVATKSREVATVFDRDLPAALAKLSGPELDKFRTAFIGALQDAGNQAQLLEKVVAATGQRAAEALGVDVVKASKQMSAEFRVAQDNFSILVRSSDELKKSGVDMGQVYEDVFAKMIAGARNQTELDVVRSRIEALGKAGEISKAQVVELMDKLRQKSDEASKGVNSLDEALRTFGIKTAVELKKTADAYAQAWEVIRSSGTATLAQQQQAFRQYAEAAIAANGGVADSTLRAQAQVLKMKIEVDGLGKALSITGDEGAGGFNKIGNAASNATSKVEALTAAQRAYDAKPGGVSGIKSDFQDKGDSPENTAGRNAPASALNRSLDGLEQLLLKERAGTLSEADRKLAESVLEAAIFNRDNFNNLSPGARGLGSQGQAGFDNQVANARRLLERAGGGSQPIGLGGSVNQRNNVAPASGGTFTVNINTSTSRSQVNVASRADANTLTNVLQELADARARSA